MPQISLIVPVYNQQSYIADCIDSLCNQTISDFELIIVDDGSTDASRSIIKQYLGDSRIIYIEQCNAGVSVARNRGIDIATAKWITFIDPDDCVPNDYLEKLLAYADSNRVVDILITSCVAFGQNVDRINQHFYPENFIASNDMQKMKLYHQLLVGNYMQRSPAYTGVGVPWGKLYLRSFLNKYKLRFDPQLRRMQDNLFNFEAFSKAASIQYVDYCGYEYRIDGLADRTKTHAKSGVYTQALIKQRHYMEHSHLWEVEELRVAYRSELLQIFNNELKIILLSKPKGHWSRKFVKEFRTSIKGLTPRNLSCKDYLRWISFGNRFCLCFYSIFMDMKDRFGV